jgi:hypothetical protein
MFERMKFMTEFAGAYRRARGTGAAHAAALDAATQETLSRRTGPADDPNTLPHRVTEVWLDPEPACGLPDGDWFGDGSFDVTQRHIDLLRQMRFLWNTAERGAPMLDPQRPYGREDLFAQLQAAFGVEDDDDVARAHVEMLFVLTRALRHASLPPGRYALHNIDATDVREAMRGYGVTDADLGLDADEMVTISHDQLLLLRAIEVRWPSRSDCEDRLEGGRYPAATADPKRPYGDFTVIEVDMARILGVLPPAPADGIFDPGPELAGRLARLHWQMLVAMQVFVEEADLSPGVYGLD